MNTHLNVGTPARNGVVKKFKWFWNDQDTACEAWLAQMARQGWHLQRVTWAGLRYTFAVGAPEQMIYRRDFSMAIKPDPNDLRLLKNAGWELVSELNGWRTWRKRVQPGPVSGMSTDAPVNIKNYQRLLLRHTMCLLPLAIGIQSTYRGMLPGSVHDESLFTTNAIPCIFLLALLFIAYDIARLVLRIIGLKNTA